MRPTVRFYIIKHRENLCNTGKTQGKQGISSWLDCGRPDCSFKDYLWSFNQLLSHLSHPHINYEIVINFLFRNDMRKN